MNKERLEQVVGDYEVYKARREEYEMGSNIPFRVSPEPLHLTDTERSDIYSIGKAVTAYYGFVDELYNTDGDVRSLLDRGKPEILLGNESSYLFFRPDLLITKDGFTMCEVETSPFGLGLADMLNKAYSQDHDTIADPESLSKHLRAGTPEEGIIAYTNKTSSYAGQLSYLAEQVVGRGWDSQQVDNEDPMPDKPIYRGFYLSEMIDNGVVKNIIETNHQEILPSLTPHLEEKAILTFVWDERFADKIRHQIGDAAFNCLRDVVPPSFIVGEEEHFIPGLPNGVEQAVDLATISRKKRSLVLKPSGFKHDASWAEGVVLLHTKSQVNAERALSLASEDKDSLYVIQDFRKCVDRPMQYYQNGELVDMAARIRVTPYFDMDGKVLTAKATGCEKTDFIHGTSSSINTAVA